MTSLKNKLMSLKFKDLCKNASEAADDVDMILGGMDWLVNDSEALKIISVLKPEIKESLDSIKSVSQPPLRNGEELIKLIDKILSSPVCKRSPRAGNKKKGVEMMRNLFEDITNEEAYNNVCYLTETLKTLLTSLISVLSKIMNSQVMKSAISSVGGPNSISKLKNGLIMTKKSLKFTESIHESICVELRRSIEK